MDMQISDSCRHPTEDGRLSTSVCHNRGDCTCGECACHSATNPTDTIFGAFCECDTFSCMRDTKTNLTCGGAARGQCCSGHCNCFNNWSGEACECTTSTTTCEAPNGKLCSGNGRCECGRCRCSGGQGGGGAEGGGRIFAGDFCEVCLTCEGRCAEVEDCLRCQYPDLGLAPVSRNQTRTRECTTRCSNYHFEFVDEFRDASRANESASLSVPRRCVFTDAHGCHLSFEYMYMYMYDYVREERAQVQVLRSRECSTPVNLWSVLAWIVGVVFAIGLLLLLIIRYAMFLKDKRDYAKWLVEVEETKELKLKNTETNPLYKEASTKYQNPLYEGHKLVHN